MGLNAINGEDLGGSGITQAALLVEFADTLVGGTAGELSRVRDRIHSEMGEQALIDSAALAAVFNAVVRIADATGIPLEPYKEEISVDLRRELGIDDYHAAAD